jgi:hypothetical protein
VRPPHSSNGLAPRSVLGPTSPFGKAWRLTSPPRSRSPLAALHVVGLPSLFIEASARRSCATLTTTTVSRPLPGVFSYKAGPQDLGPQIAVVHVYGSAYQMGVAQGALLAHEMGELLPAVIRYLVKSVPAGDASIWELGGTGRWFAHSLLCGAGGGGAPLPPTRTRLHTVWRHT